MFQRDPGFSRLVLDHVQQAVAGLLLQVRFQIVDTVHGLAVTQLPAITAFGDVFRDFAFRLQTLAIVVRLINHNRSCLERQIFRHDETRFFSTTPCFMGCL